MKEIIIVTGCGRCGSTLLMRMLHAGGMPVIVDNYISYELKEGYFNDPKRIISRFKPGHAIKLIDLFKHKIPITESFKIIYLKRDVKQQGKSQIKLLRESGFLIKEKQPHKRMAKSIEADNKTALQMFRDKRLLVINFEDLLNDCFETVSSIVRFVGDPELNVLEMTKQIKSRSTDCAPDMSIEYEYIIAEKNKRVTGVA